MRLFAGVTIAAVLSLVVHLRALAQSVPAHMQAIVQHGFGAADVLQLEEVPVPSADRGQVLVHVYAAGVNPADWKSRLSRPSAPASESRPAASAIPGLEIAGVIDALGPQVSGYSIGEPVYGRIASMHGGYAQYAVIGVDSIAPKPQSLTFEQAAGAAEVGRTVLRALDDGRVHANETVVVIGAAGGLGSAAVQLAKARGARIVAIASSTHNGYLRRLGADQIINYDKSGSLSKLVGADVVINTVESQDNAAISYARRGGTVLEMAGQAAPGRCAGAAVNCPSEQGASAAQRSGISDARRLVELNRLIRAGQFTVHIERTFPLAQAADAQEFNRAGHAEGKLVLIVTPPIER